LLAWEKVEYQADPSVFTQGQQGDSLYALYAGRVTALYGTPEGTLLRLRSLVRHLDITSPYGHCSFK
jgi:hypothetical protein